MCRGAYCCVGGRGPILHLVAELQAHRLSCKTALVRHFPLSMKPGGPLPKAVVKLIKQQEKEIVFASSKNLILVVIN